MTVGEVFINIFTDITVVLRFWQTIIRKSSNLTPLPLRNLSHQVKSTLRYRTGALDRLAA